MPWFGSMSIGANSVNNIGSVVMSRTGGRVIFE